MGGRQPLLLLLFLRRPKKNYFVRCAGISSGAGEHGTPNSSSTTSPNVRGKERKKPRPIASPTANATADANRSSTSQPVQQPQPAKPRRHQPHALRFRIYSHSWYPCWNL